MARLEIPSIVVHNGSNSAPGSPSMECSLDKQAELEVLNEEAAAVALSGRSLPPPYSSCVTDDAIDKLKEEAHRPIVATETDDKPPPPSRVRPHSKVKLLVRSHAMREETSPPPDPDIHHPAPVPSTGPPLPPPPQLQQQQQQQQSSSSTQPIQPSAGTGHSLSVNRSNSRHKLRHQGSSQGSIDSCSPCLSRDSSTEQYTDSTGVDLQQFISDTLNRNPKDRMMLLKIEQELTNLARDPKRAHHKFPPMSSYQRMLVHRVAAFFGMDHNVDTTGQSVIVNCMKSTRVPEIRFRDLIRDELLFPEEPRRSILKRDSSSFEDGCNFKSPERQFSSEPRRSKSFEEREEEYEKVRKRIFHRDDGGADSSHRSSQEELRWPGEVQPWSSSDSDASGLRSGQLRPTRLLKVESFEGRDTLKANSLRLSVSKSFSFGGYPVSVLARADSSARLLTKQDSGSSMSSRLSPSSSGYKSQSQRSDTTMSATPSPTATPVSQVQVSSQSPQPSQTVMWAVTSMAAVPPGSVLINPQTGQPFVNSDGSIYRYDPANPPKVPEENSNAAQHNSSTESCQTQTHSKKVQSTTSSTSSPPSKVVTSPNVTTTATSPSLPISPPPPTAVQQTINSPPTVTQAPVLTVCHSGQCSYVPHPPEQPHLYQPQSFNPSEVVFGGQQQPQPPPPPQMVYTGFNVVPVPSNGNNSVQAAPFEQRHAEPGNSMSVTELGNYFMGLGVVADQRGGGDSNQPPPPSAQPHPHYQPGPPAYWQPQQPTSQMQHTQQPPQQPVPLYYVPPTGQVLNTSPPQQPPATGNANPGTARYVTYPPYQPATNATAPAPICHPPPQSHQDRTQPGINHNGSYIAGFPVASYGATPVMGAATGNGECLPLYTQPSLHMLYSTPTSIHMNTLSSSSTSMVPAPTSALPYYHHHAANMGPYMQPGQPSYRAPTPPQTPSQNQTLCNVGAHPYMYLNGASYGPMYNGTGAASGGSGAPNGTAPTTHYNQQPPGAPSTPGPAQYIPPALIPNLGLFRTNMQMMSGVRSSPPPRPPRDGSGNKPTYSRSPSVGSKDRNSSHYEVCGSGDKTAGMRYPSMPVFGLRIMPGDMRLVGPPLQQPLSTPSPALRMPFALPPHRVQPQASTHYQPGNQSSGSEVSLGSSGRPPKARKPRSKVTVSMSTNLSRSSQSQTTPAAIPVTLTGSGGEGPAVSGMQDSGRILMLADGTPAAHH